MAAVTICSDFADAGRDWGQEEKGTTEDEMAGWHHEIKRCLLLGRKVMTNLDSILKSRDIILPTKVHLVKAMFMFHSLSMCVFVCFCVCV